MLKKVFAGLAALVVIFCGVVAMQPSDFSISRSLLMPGSPAEVFAYVNDLRQWENWSPWAKVDLSMKKTYEGPEQGVGAAYHWTGNAQVGAGKMTIVKSVPSEKIVIHLEFLKPMAATNMTEFRFVHEGGGTMVTWTMSGKNGFLSKALGLFMDMDKMVGAQFEQGLNQLKAVVESGRS